MLELKNIKKYYGEFLALDNISLKLGKKGLVGLLGPNGAGKSTLMRILCGYYIADEGDYLLNGDNINNDLFNVKRKIGYLPETPPLYLELTVKEYLRFVCELKAIASHKIEKEIERVSKELHIDKRLNQLTGNLSKGYRQRVGIAMAILGDPSIVILDEPMVGLDPIQIKETRKLISKIGEKSLVIISSHILSEIQDSCDSIIMLNKGTIDFQKDTGDILNKSEDEIIVELKKDSSDFIPFLKKLTDLKINNIELLEEKRYLISGEELDDKRDVLLKEIVEKDFNVISFLKKEKNLEDLFK